MSLSTLLIALQVEFDTVTLPAQHHITATQLLREMAEPMRNQALFLELTEFTLTVSAMADVVVDGLLDAYQRLLHPDIQASLYGVILSATTSMTAAGKTLSQRSLARVKESARFGGAGRVCIASQTLQLLSYYSPQHAAVFDKNKMQSTVAGELIEFSPSASGEQPGGNPVVFSGMTALLPPPGALRDGLMENVEQALSAYLGPMAHPLVTRSNALAENWKEFVFMLTKDLPPALLEPCKQVLAEIWRRYLERHNSSY